VNLSLEVLEKTRINDISYKTIKTFRNKEKAEEYAESVDSGSVRFPVIVEPVRIGLWLGFLYRVKRPVL